MTKTLQRLLAASCLVMATTASAAPSETICSDQPALLAKHEGIYAQQRMVEGVRAARSWEGGRLSRIAISEIRVSSEGSVQLSMGWHEAATLGKEIKQGCLVFDDQKVTLQHEQLPQPHPYIRVGSTTTVADVDAPYFDMVFSGCYLDQTKKRWCFTTNALEIAGKSRHATLMLDRSELPGGGSLLTIQGEKDLWLFEPRTNGEGWNVHRTTWVTSDAYREPYWAKPWKVLTPVK